jgi:SAM-dependent methyltransferase
MLANLKPKEAFQKFLNLLELADIKDRERVARVAFYLDKKPNYEDKYNSYELEKIWYESLEKEEPDYSIYDSDLYISEAWNCWNNYSRIYLKLLEKTKDQFIGVKTIADLGCGIGFTTASLTNIFSNAKVIGTNVLTGNQAKIACILGKEFNFEMQEELNTEVDLIFASEYFEHFLDPIDHLKKILDVAHPNYLIAANAFNSSAPGHFPYYMSEGKKKTGKEIGKIFSSVLKDYNYEKLKLGFWNNRPSVWKRVEL